MSVSFLEILRDPAWSGIGVILSIIFAGLSRWKFSNANKLIKNEENQPEPFNHEIGHSHKPSKNEVIVSSESKSDSKKTQIQYNNKALAAFWVAIVGLFLFAPISTASIYFGRVALREISQSEENLKGRLLAEIGMLLGYAVAVFFAVMLTLALFSQF